MDSSFTDLLRRHLRFLPADQPLETTAPLRDLGLTSMQAIEVMFDIEDLYGVSLDDDQLNDTTFSTAGHLWQAVDDARSRAAA
ncbi:phosphopantetheine-binding protein [Streptomyces sp. NPDC052496]|uniref:phosphopantetheine-binding protein n=1 Tax=Streptomyces sp. NPDC052496 TaxID=3154951 RepID=UPI00342621A1